MNNRSSASSISKIRCGVIGVGYLGRFHAQKYKLLQEQGVEQAELVGIADADSERAQKVAEEINTRAFQNVEALLDTGVEAVTIAASTASHFDLAYKCLSAGVHVHLEKPMTTTVEEARKLVDLARKKNLILQVGHVERFNSALTAARKRMHQPLFIECHRLAPFKPRGVDVDVVLDVMIHDLDVLLMLVRSPVVQVSAVGTPVITRQIDIANARIEFESGAVANVTSSRVSQNSTRKFRVFQHNQYLSIDFGSGEVHLTTKTGEWQPNTSIENVPLELDSWSLEKTDALLEETKAFLQAVRRSEPQEIAASGEEGLKAMVLAEQIRSEIYKRLAKIPYDR